MKNIKTLISLITVIQIIAGQQCKVDFQQIISKECPKEISVVANCKSKFCEVDRKTMATVRQFAVKDCNKQFKKKTDECSRLKCQQNLMENIYSNEYQALINCQLATCDCFNIWEYIGKTIVVLLVSLGLALLTLCAVCHGKSKQV